MKIVGNLFWDGDMNSMNSYYFYSSLILKFK